MNVKYAKYSDTTCVFGPTPLVYRTRDMASSLTDRIIQHVIPHRSRNSTSIPQTRADSSDEDPDTPTSSISYRSERLIMVSIREYDPSLASVWMSTSSAPSVKATSSTAWSAL